MTPVISPSLPSLLSLLCNVSAVFPPSLVLLEFPPAQDMIQSSYFLLPIVIKVMLKLSLTLCLSFSFSLSISLISSAVKNDRYFELLC